MPLQLGDGSGCQHSSLQVYGRLKSHAVPIGVKSTSFAPVDDNLPASLL